MTTGQNMTDMSYACGHYMADYWHWPLVEIT